MFAMGRTQDSAINNMEIKLDVLTKNYLNAVDKELQKKSINLSTKTLYRRVILEDKTLILPLEHEKATFPFLLSQQK